MPTLGNPWHLRQNRPDLGRLHISSCAMQARVFRHVNSAATRNSVNRQRDSHVIGDFAARAIYYPVAPVDFMRPSLPTAFKAQPARTWPGRYWAQRTDSKKMRPVVRSTLFRSRASRNLGHEGSCLAHSMTQLISQ